MRDLIKKILKEENDFDTLDWIKNTNPIESIGEYIENTIKRDYKHVENWSDRKVGDWFEAMYWSLATLVGDAEEMVEYAKNVNNENLSVDQRLSALESYEDYSTVGFIVQDVKQALKFFGPFIDEYNLKLTDVLQYAIGHYSQKR